MLPGPVFTFELMTTARKARFYLARAFYALVLLLVLWTVFSAWSQATDGELSINQVRWFAFSVFCSIAIGQELLVLVLTPALVAGVIADEKRRKTLHYLLASRLSSSEIVLGKLLVRMLYVLVLFGVSLPVLSLLVLLGGIDPFLVLLAVGATLSTAWFVAALSIWVSTIARRPREALFVAFGLEGLWLLGPLLVSNLRLSSWPALDTPAQLFVDWVGATSPVSVYWALLRGMVLAPGSRWDVALVAWMIGLQLASGSVLAGLAAVQLRPIFRRQQGGAARRGLWPALMSRSRWFGRLPALGDRPMLWKELHTGRPRGFARIIGFLLTLIAGGFLAYYSAWFGLNALTEWWEFDRSVAFLGGPLVWPIQDAHWARDDRRHLFKFLQTTLPLIYLVAVVRVAGAAASAITSEHEDDTWVSLTTTDLTGRDIVVSKLIGALKRGLRLAAIVLLLAGFGVLVGSVDLLALPALIAALAAFGWFAAALGVWVSIQLRSTWRAQFLTLACLLLINVVGQGLANALNRHGYAPMVWAGFTPYELSKLVFDPAVLRSLPEIRWPAFWWLRDIDDGPGWLAIFSIVSLIGYPMLAAALTWDALRRFSIVAGRARRPRRPRLVRSNIKVQSGTPQFELTSG